MNSGTGIKDFYEYLEMNKIFKYDMIQSSNLTDWMNNKKLDSFMNWIKYNLNQKGFVIIRRLNGDYFLKDQIKDHFKICDKVPYDKSEFYKEVIVAQN